MNKTLVTLGSLTTLLMISGIMLATTNITTNYSL